MGLVLTRILAFFARNGRLVLVAGLLAGILLPDVAAFLKPYLPHMVATTLFLAAFRIGPKDALGGIRELPQMIGLIGLYQIAIPLVFILVLPFTGLSPVLVTALTLMAAAPSISGTPNLTIMLGHDPAPALRLLIAGTALVPLTSFIVFFFVPAFGSATAVALAAFRLLLLIGTAAAIAFTLRILFFKQSTNKLKTNVDGLSALAMAGIVIGLMTAVGPALKGDPANFLLVLALACFTSFSLQMLAYFGLLRSVPHDRRVGHSLIAGCRNNALFIAALPTAITDPLLLYIGCYQIPMYLTPLLLGRVYKNATNDQREPAS